jgi:hypothetical protein
LRDTEVQAAIEIDEGLGSPDGFAERFPRYDFTGLREQQRENLGGL